MERKLLSKSKARGLDGHFFITLNELIEELSAQIRKICNFMDIEAIDGLENRQRASCRTIKEKGKEWLFESQKPLLKKERCAFKEVFDIEERDYLSQKINDTIN